MYESSNIRILFRNILPRFVGKIIRVVKKIIATNFLKI